MATTAGEVSGSSVKLRCWRAARSTKSRTDSYVQQFVVLASTDPQPVLSSRWIPGNGHGIDPVDGLSFRFERCPAGHHHP